MGGEEDVEGAGSAPVATLCCGPKCSAINFLVSIFGTATCCAWCSGRLLYTGPGNGPCDGSTTGGSPKEYNWRLSRVGVSCCLSRGAPSADTPGAVAGSTGREGMGREGMGRDDDVDDAGAAGPIATLCCGNGTESVLKSTAACSAWDSAGVVSTGCGSSDG